MITGNDSGKKQAYHIEVMSINEASEQASAAPEKTQNSKLRDVFRCSLQHEEESPHENVDTKIFSDRESLHHEIRRDLKVRVSVRTLEPYKGYDIDEEERILTGPSQESEVENRRQPAILRPTQI